MYCKIFPNVPRLKEFKSDGSLLYINISAVLLDRMIIRGFIVVVPLSKLYVMLTAVQFTRWQ